MLSCHVRRTFANVTSFFTKMQNIRISGSFHYQVIMNKYETSRVSLISKMENMFILCVSFNKSKTSRMSAS